MSPKIHNFENAENSEKAKDLDGGDIEYKIREQGVESETRNWIVKQSKRLGEEMFVWAEDPGAGIDRRLQPDGHSRDGGQIHRIHSSESESTINED